MPFKTLWKKIRNLDEFSSLVTIVPEETFSIGILRHKKGYKFSKIAQRSSHRREGVAKKVDKGER